jgi:hypothetical protein
MPGQTVAEKDCSTAISPEPLPLAPWRIRALSVLSDHRLAVTFMDGRHGIVDCSSVCRSSDTGIYAALSDPQYFAQVRLEFGAPTWPNGADLDPAWLYDSLVDRKLWSVPI